MNIEQMRNEMKALHAEIANARSDAMKLATDAEAKPDALVAAQTRLDQLKARQGILKESLENEMEQQSANLQKIKGNSDAIQSAADKFKSAGDFFNVVARASDPTNPIVDPRLADYMRVRSAAGQNLTTDADGGYLVPPQYSDELLNVAESESMLFNEVDKIPVTSNRLITNELDQESRKDTDADRSVKGRNGGLLAYWAGEAAQYTASQMKFKQNQTDVHKLTGMCYATEEMLEDLPALAGVINAGFADEFAFKIDDAILNGTGTGMPVGILNAKNTALVTVAKESGQEAGTLLLNNILKMYNAMPSKNRSRAKWYINQDLEIVLYQLLMNTGSLATEGVTLATGFPLFVPAGGISSAPNGMLLGRPIVPVEQAGALGAAGDISFIDASQYRWIDRGGMKSQTSIHVRFLNDETAFKFTYRAGGKPKWGAAIEAYKGTTKRSPYVTLAARA